MEIPTHLILKHHISFYKPCMNKDLINQKRYFLIYYLMFVQDHLAF